LAFPSFGDDAGAVTLTPRDIGRLLETHGLTPSRALGQNFVADPNTVRRIVRLADLTAGDHVVEIGAGLGSLTVALAEAGAVVTAVEVDRHLVPALREVVAGLDVEIVEADALHLDWNVVLGGHRPWTLVANLPYNVATPLVLDLLDEVPAIEEMLVMVQREVGERLAAAAGTSAYGIPSVKVAYWARAELVGRVPPTVFVPQPRVESVLVRISRRSEPAVSADPTVLFALVRAAFGQRRKMLRRSLAGQVGAGAFERAGVDSDRRPEQLGIDDWGRLADAVTATS
jgi:16S rRNA (adenine1518-N6/adenine1519-N6)-dimethyltransferase